jgi:hypothetical protein
VTDAVGNTAAVGHMSRQEGMLKKLGFQKKLVSLDYSQGKEYSNAINTLCVVRLRLGLIIRSVAPILWRRVSRIPARRKTALPIG